MPSREEIVGQLDMTMKVKQQLTARGDDESKEHAIEHHFYASSVDALEDLRKYGMMLGFDGTPIEEGSDHDRSYFHCDLISYMPTRLNDLGRESVLMLALAEGFGASYDGWGTNVLK